jgi:hypothetical protein
MDQMKANSFSEFVHFTDLLDLVYGFYIFRGQAFQGNLIPGIARKNPTIDTTDLEKEVIEQLSLMGASLLPSEATANKLELLVIAQHSGLKTRLLDWTSNPLAALWFACADKRDGDAFVYALGADNLRVKDVYENNPFEISNTRVFQPRLNNPRIIAQHGWFTLHRYSTKDRRFVSLEENPTTNKHLTEIRIPEKKRNDVLRSLEVHGISSRTLFPDLDGLCRNLNSKHRLE